MVVMASVVHIKSCSEWFPSGGLSGFISAT